MPALDSGPSPLPLPRAPLRGGSGYRGPATESCASARCPRKVNVNMPVPHIAAPVDAETPAALSLRRFRIPFFRDIKGRWPAERRRIFPGFSRLRSTLLIEKSGGSFGRFTMILTKTDIVEGKVPEWVLRTCSEVFGARDLFPPGNSVFWRPRLKTYFPRVRNYASGAENEKISIALVYYSAPRIWTIKTEDSSVVEKYTRARAPCPI